MIRIALLALLAIGISAQEYPHLWCYDGSLVQIPDGSVVFDNRTARACNYGEICVKYEIASVEYTQEYGPVDLSIQSGLCLDKYYAEYVDLCELARNYTSQVVNSCSASLCNTTGCNAFREPSFCPQEPENDINILPNCTMREVFHEMQTCMEPLARGYPFQDQQVCLSSLDEVVSCVARTAEKCLNSSCFTVLDILPDLRYIYKEVVKYAHYTHSVDDILDIVATLAGNGSYGIEETVRTVIRQYVCPAPGQIPYLPTVEEVMSLIGGVPNPICDAELFRDLAGRGIEFARRFYMVSTQQELCVAFNEMANSIYNMITTRCQLDAIPGLIHGLLPPPFDRMFGPTIAKALSIAQDIFNNIQLPECGVTPPGPGINCDEYYYATSACGKRKAWFCDFAKWRVEVVESYFPAYFKWAEENGIEVPFGKPPCNMQDARLCRNPEKRRCYYDTGDCNFCYCTDHDYINPAAVRKQWRHDSETYRHFFQVYQYISSHHNTC